MGITYLFVAHDLSMVRHISHRIAVMYQGRIVEVAPSGEIYRHPLHPYTRALLSAIPIPNPKRAREVQRIPLQGEITDAPENRAGCPFQPRCPQATPACAENKPALKTVGPEHYVSCLLHE
jgi:oligopeptide/dipeptide ABC transporter ATP-binding protein